MAPCTGIQVWISYLPFGHIMGNRQIADGFGRSLSTILPPADGTWSSTCRTLACPSFRETAPDTRIAAVLVVPGARDRKPAVQQAGGTSHCVIARVTHMNNARGPKTLKP